MYQTNEYIDFLHHELVSGFCPEQHAHPDNALQFLGKQFRHKYQAKSAPMPLTPIGSWQPSEPELYLPILDEINEITRVGTTGAYLTAVQAAAKLLDWASGTGLDPLEVKDATVRWLQNQGEDAQQEIRQKLEQVDNAIRDLLGENAEDLLSSAGCGNTGYPWDEYPLAYIEAIMEAIGLR